MSIASARRKLPRAQDMPVWFSVPVIAILIGIIVRIVIRNSTSLWEDEIIAVTHATQPFLGVIVDALANDMHPPLYFLELHFWSLLGHSDGWLIANSILFGILAVGSLFYVVRELSNTTRALVAAAVFAVLPVPIWMSGEVRMYALMSVLLIWMFCFSHKVFALAEPGAKSRIAVVLLALALVASHSIGFIAVFFFALYAASCLAIRRAVMREWLILLLLFGIPGILALPQIAKDILFTADMAPISGINGVFGWMASVVAGGGYNSVAWLPATGLVVWLAVAIFGALVPRTRLVTLCFLIAPIVLCLIIEILKRPMFKSNFFPNLCSPFLAMVIGSLVLALPVKKSLRSLALTGVLAGLLTMAIADREILNASNTYFKKSVVIISAQEKPGDVVWAPQQDVFCGMAWYLAGAGWGSPITVSAPLPPQSRRWKIFDFLGPYLTEKLQLIPKYQAITAKGGLPILVSAASRAQAEQAKRVWLVTFAPRGDLPADLPGDALGPLRRSESFSFPPVQLNLYELPGEKSP